MPDLARSTPEKEVRAPGPLVLIAPQLPPAICGVGDYSMALVEELRLESPPRFLTMRGAAATRATHPAMKVEDIPMNGKWLATRLAALGAERVVLEYVAQGFHSRGCPLWLLNGLRRWRRATPGARLVIMFHELWFEAAWWKPDFFLQWLHRRAIRQLTERADGVFVTTPGFRGWLAPWVPAERLRVLPSASNIPPVEPPVVGGRAAGRWVLFGRQGSRVAALETIGPWLKQLHACGRLRLLQMAGSRDSEEANRREDALLAAALPPGAWEVLGLQPPEGLSRLFLQAEYGVFDQTPASYWKSGVFMAYGSHGLNILSAKTLAAHEETPDCWVTHPSELLADLSTAEQMDRASKLLGWYRENVSWPRIADAYRAALALPALEGSGR